MLIAERTHLLGERSKGKSLSEYGLFKVFLWNEKSFSLDLFRKLRKYRKYIEYKKEKSHPNSIKVRVGLWCRWPGSIARLPLANGKEAASF